MAVVNQFVLLDYVIILSTLAFGIVGARRGFSRTAAGTVAVLVALIGAIVGSGTLSSQMTACLNRTVSTSLASQLAAYLPSGDESVGNELAAAIMAVLQNTIVKGFLFTVIFLVILLIWLYACNYFDVAAKFPEIKRFNQLWGFLLGVVKGGVVVIVVLYIFSQLGILSDNILTDSFLLQKAVGVFHITL